MKKRLVVLSTLVGLMLLISFSVFADTNINPHIWTNSGFNSDNTVSYYYVIKEFKNNYTIDINLTNQSSDYSAVFNTSYIEFHFENYVLTNADIPNNVVVTGGAFVSDYKTTLTTQSSGSVWCVFDIDLFLENAVLQPSESKDYQIVLTFNTGLFNVTTTRSTLVLPNTTEETDPNYEATVTANNIATQEQVIHQQEIQWYQANEQAINDVGLANFNFGSGSLGGLAVMQQQFANIWSALGDLNLIYIFTLTISLATFIIRHMPRTKQTEVAESNDIRKNLVRNRR